MKWKACAHLASLVCFFVFVYVMFSGKSNDVDAFAHWCVLIAHLSWVVDNLRFLSEV